MPPKVRLGQSRPIQRRSKQRMAAISYAEMEESSRQKIAGANPRDLLWFVHAVHSLPATPWLGRYCSGRRPREGKGARRERPAAVWPGRGWKECNVKREK